MDPRRRIDERAARLEYDHLHKSTPKLYLAIGGFLLVLILIAIYSA